MSKTVIESLVERVNYELKTIGPRCIGDRFDVDYVNAGKLVAAFEQACDDEKGRCLMMNSSSILAARIIAYTIHKLITVDGCGDLYGYVLPHDVTLDGITCHTEGPNKDGNPEEVLALGGQRETL